MYLSADNISGPGGGGGEALRGFVLRFFAFKTRGEKYVSRLYFESFPRDLTSLRCRLHDDPTLYTFDELNEKISGALLRGKFLLYLVNTETGQEEPWRADLIKYCLEAEDATNELTLTFDIEEILKELGY